MSNCYTLSRPVKFTRFAVKRTAYHPAKPPAKQVKPVQQKDVA